MIISAKPKNKGFTLIELLVVISIIAILSTVGITIYSQASKNAKDIKRKADIEAIARAMEQNYDADSLTYPALQGSFFSSGNIPTPPEGGQYVLNKQDNKSYQYCAYLEDGTPFCKQNAQGEIIAYAIPTPRPSGGGGGPTSPPATAPPATSPPTASPTASPPTPIVCTSTLPESVNNGYGSYKSAQSPGAVFPCSGWRPYADNTPFNQPVPANPSISANSAAIVSTWFSLNPDNMDVGLSTSTSIYKDWDHPIYFSQPGDPLYTITCTKYGGACEISGAQIRIPVGAKPASGGDGHMAIIDQSTNTEYDFWQAETPSGTGGPLNISFGGKTEILGDGLNSDATAAWFGTAAGMIRASEWSAGTIDHALFITTLCSSGSYVYPSAPATGRKCGTFSVGGVPDTHDPTKAPAIGARFYLAMTPAEIDATGLATWKKTLMKAMAKYGMYVGDTGGTNWEIKKESGFSYTSFGYTDPMRTFASSNGATAYQDFWIFKFPEIINYANKIYMIDP